MTRFRALYVPTGLSTRMHIAMPQLNAGPGRALGTSFAFAKLLLSIVGIHATLDENRRADTPMPHWRRE